MRGFTSGESMSFFKAFSVDFYRFLMTSNVPLQLLMNSLSNLQLDKEALQLLKADEIYDIELFAISRIGYQKGGMIDECASSFGINIVSSL